MPARISTFTSGLTPSERAETVRDAYKKHAKELLALEEAQQKLTLIFLGVFGAGASFLASTEASLQPWAIRGLTAVVIAVLLFAGAYTYQRNRARQAVRGLLVRTEEALGFFEPDAYVKSESLYPQGYLQYPQSGAWLGWLSFAVVILGGIGFLLVLWNL